jgi:hypothetical protein
MDNKRKFDAEFERLTQIVGIWEKVHKVNDVKRLTYWYADTGIFLPKYMSEEYFKLIAEKCGVILTAQVSRREEKSSGYTSVLKTIKDSKPATKPPRKAKAPKKHKNTDNIEH